MKIIFEALRSLGYDNLDLSTVMNALMELEEAGYKITIEAPDG
jgi:hypothetical protein